MGKKIFRFSQTEAAARPGAPEAPAREAALLAGSQMRDLIRREYPPEQVLALKEMQHQEGAARYDSMPKVNLQEQLAPQTDMFRMMSEQTGLRFIDLKSIPRVGHKLRALLTAEQANTLRVVPVEELPNGLVVVAIADPSNPTIADDLRTILGREVETVIADEGEITERIHFYYGLGDESIEDILEKEAQTAGDEDVISQNADVVDLSDIEALAMSKPIIQVVNTLLLRAINDRASDIHVEPFPNFIRIRYRVDGVLREVPAPPRSQLVAIVSRIKVLAKMNISESRLPQDGRIKLNLEGREMDLRVSSVPTVNGESIVMRVLDKSMMMIGISNIGMMGILEEFKRVIRKPNGVILATGPTGSGKTTTLYAALAEVQDPGEKLITTEDPVEYEMEGIQQVNINPAVDLTYGRCLRAILRQDPDKILVGEIRDVETAQIAVQAALTGHLVFSTLHTNSAAATITRLLDMGIEPFLITSALEAVIGQRLVRTVCQGCKVAYMPDPDMLEAFGMTEQDVREQGIVFHHGEGCADCGHTGYHGRLGIYELMIIDDEIRDMIIERATTDEIHDAVVRKGMMTMRKDGWIKACLGITTLNEVERQTPREESAFKPHAQHEDDDQGAPGGGLPAPTGSNATPLAGPAGQLPGGGIGLEKEEATRSHGS